MHWGYSGYTRGEIRKQLDDIKTREEHESHFDYAREEMPEIGDRKKWPGKSKVKEYKST